MNESKINPYNEDILRQENKRSLPKKFKNRLAKAMPFVLLRRSVREIPSDYSRLLVLIWDNENYVLPDFRKKELKDLIAKYKKGGD